MAESGITDVVKGVFSLSDRYERKARFFPTAFVVLPIAIAAFAVANAKLTPLLSTGIAAATELVMIVFLGMVARHLGVRYEKRLFEGRLPTDEWLAALSPRSAQQVDQWADSLLALTGLDIRVEDPEERTKVVRDATMQARKRLRDHPAAQRTQEYNEDYGLIRNMAGLTPVWLGVSVLGGVICAIFHAWLGAAIEAAFAVAAILFLMMRRSLVRWSAERYAESFLSTVVLAAEEKRT